LQTPETITTLWRCGPLRRLIFGPVILVMGGAIAWASLLAGQVPGLVIGPLISLYALYALVTAVREARVLRAGGYVLELNPFTWRSK
jgi:hypothetical protein